MANIQLVIIHCMLVLAFISTVASADGLAGGLNGEIEPTDDVREAVKSVRKEIEAKAQETYIVIEPISYRRQVVAGLNYFVKAAAIKANGDNSYLHLRIYKPFRGPVELTSMMKDVSRQKPLEHFL